MQQCLRTEKNRSGPQMAKLPPGSPNFALCPNDFSLDFTEIAADFALAGAAIQIEFYDRKLKLEFHASVSYQRCRLLAYQEIDDVFGLTDMVACKLRDNRAGKNTNFLLKR